MYDLSHRIIQPDTKPKRNDTRLHPWRRLLQVICGLSFIILPLTNALRLDLRAGAFYIAGRPLPAGDRMITFWAFIIAVYGLVVFSFLYGRLWCGWVCPQTWASDFAESLKRRLDKAFKVRITPVRFPFPGGERVRVRGKNPLPLRTLGWGCYLSRSLWSLIMLLTAVGTGIVLVYYWISPAATFHAAIAPSSDPAVALSVYGIGALVAFDLLYVRRKFCNGICPYGAYMGLVADNNTLTVRYLNERDNDCIHCGKCVTVCPMGIDIKDGPGQLACIGCGECVDACNDILGKRNLAGLIEYRYGISPNRTPAALRWYQKLGLWDTRRIALLITLAVFLAAPVIAFLYRMPLAISIQNNGATQRYAGEIRNSYALTIDNGDLQPQTVEIVVKNLQTGTIVSPSHPVHVGAHASVTVPLILAARVNSLKPNSHTLIDIIVKSKNHQASQQLIFYYPGLRG